METKKRFTAFEAVKTTTGGLGGATDRSKASRLFQSSVGESRQPGVASRRGRSSFLRASGSRFASTVLLRGFALLNRFVPWYRLPTWVSVANLVALRQQLRHKNLYSTGNGGGRLELVRAREHPRCLYARTADGTFNDLEDPTMGGAGARFGRNIPLSRARPEPSATIWEPNPRLISERLLARDTFQPATSLNLLAAAWIQFMTHDWFSHGVSEDDEPIELPLPQGDTWRENPMKIRRTRRDPYPSPSGPPTYRNEVTHWWDASQLYGSDEETLAKLRSFCAGKLALAEDAWLPVERETNMEVTGFRGAWWIGLSALHNLFTLEHNAICDRLRHLYPTWKDDQLFDTARLINSALIAKIHTIEWTPGILATPVLGISMNANWWGLAGEQVHKLLGRRHESDEISGIVGGEPDHHAAEFSITEEFVAVYRLHPLLPDSILFRSAQSDERLFEKAMPHLTFGGARQTIDENKLSLSDLLYSFGRAHPGRIQLHNYPQWLRNLALADGERVDLATVDIVRDRERGVPRYNDFRELMHMPRARSFDEMTDNKEWAQQLRAIYGEVDRVDLLVGMLAETPPPGFGFSDTAFRVFLLMASRRLKSDRFFTRDFRPEIYTPEGIAWIQENNMRTVLLRHCPELRPALRGVKNGFAPWAPVRAEPGDSSSV